jgi:hypothetical protein
MKKTILSLLIIVQFNILVGQAPSANELVNIHRASTTEMNGIIADSGSLIFNSDSLMLYVSNGTTWFKVDQSDSTDEILDSAQINADSSHFFIGAEKISSNNAPRVFMGTFTINSTGDVTISGLPFKPSLVKFTAYANVDSDTLNADNGVGNNNNTKENSYGYMSGFVQEYNGNITQQVICSGGNGNSINDISRFASPNLCVGMRYGNQNGDNVGETFAAFKSFNNDGFTLTVTQKDDNLLVIYTAYR